MNRGSFAMVYALMALMLWAAFFEMLASILLVVLLVVLGVAGMLLLWIWSGLPPGLQRTLKRILVWIILWGGLVIYVETAVYIAAAYRGGVPRVPLSYISAVSLCLASALMILGTWLWSKSSTFRSLAKPVVVAAALILVAYILLVAAPLYVFSFTRIHAQHPLLGHDLLLSRQNPCVAGGQNNVGGGRGSGTQRCISWYYQFYPTGMRKWVQARNDTWDESYPPDPKIRDEFHISGHATLNGVHGVIAYKVSMSNFEVFVPDDDTPKPFFILMRWTNGRQGWARLGEVN